VITRQVLRFMRQYAGLTTTEMATRIGYNQSYVSMVEIGSRSISDEYMRRILKVFDFTVQDFIQ